MADNHSNSTVKEEIAMLVEVMREAWEEVEGPLNGLHWLIRLYPTFAYMAAAILEHQRRTPEPGLAVPQKS